jgi:small subunit ribosomal protein S5
LEKIVAENQQLIEKVITINRVAKVTKGGKKLSFSALVVVGNGQGRVGFGFDKANEVADGIRKSLNMARKNIFTVPVRGTTIPHEIVGQYGAAKVLLKPAPPGTGIIAGAPVRALCEAAGIKDILTKCLGTNNSINVIKATVAAFNNLRLKNEFEVEPPAEDKKEEETK